MNSIGLHFSSLVRKIVVRMSSTNSSYEDAIRKLNSLQSNNSTIEQIKKSIKTGEKCTNIEDMQNYLSRIGISMSKLDELSVIHVAGTKGKGSTSAMCESILRQHGFRTGFYSSPHLVAARERIRLDGQPLSKNEFAETLHHVYGLLWNTQAYDGDMPKYFAFLTVCAFSEFLRRRVDVAVIEVGIGGIVDYTNVLRKVPVVGITALGLDHTSILGTSLPEIAAAKAGVMKTGCDAYTVVQERDALDVLYQYADIVKCPLTIVPNYATYKFESPPHLPVDLEAYKTNASLAIQLSHAWMRQAQAKMDLKCSCVNEDKGQNRLNGTYDNKDQNCVNGFEVIDQNCKETNTGNKLYSLRSKDQNGSPIIVNGLHRNNISENHSDKVKDMMNGERVTNGVNKIENDLTNGKLNDNIVINNNKAMNGNVQTNMYENGLTKNNLENGKIKYSHKAVNGIAKMEKDVTNFNEGTNNDKSIVINGKNLENVVKNGNTLENGDTNFQKLENSINNNHELASSLSNANILGQLVLEVPQPTVQGLSQCRWPGRYQVIDTGFTKFYLDGAHTKESMEICAQWFLDKSSTTNKSLMFTATGDRNAATLLQPITHIPFTHIYFVNPHAQRITHKNNDNYSLVEQQELEQRCQKHAQIWREKNQTTKVHIFDCVADALECIKEMENANIGGVKETGNGQSVLITGSLHLVGAALSILDPSLSS